MTHDRGRDLPVLDEGVLQDLKDVPGAEAPMWQPFKQTLKSGM